MRLFILLALFLLSAQGAQPSLRLEAHKKSLAPAQPAAEGTRRRRHIVAQNLSFSSPNGERVSFSIAMRSAQLDHCIKTCGSPSTSRPTYAGCVDRCNKLFGPSHQ
jgi:hypothetical protein